MATVAELETVVEQLRAVITALQDPRPHHRHYCPKGVAGTEHEWRCPSPYCEPPWNGEGNLCPEHGGTVRGAPHA
jgi:hypothetical protein